MGRHCSDRNFTLGGGTGAATNFVRGNAMVRLLNARAVANLGIASALTLFLGACGGGMSLPSFSSSPATNAEPGGAPEMPATIRADEIVVRWGLASTSELQSPSYLVCRLLL